MIRPGIPILKFFWVAVNRSSLESVSAGAASERVQIASQTRRKPLPTGSPDSTWHWSLSRGAICIWLLAAVLGSVGCEDFFAEFFPPSVNTPTTKKAELVGTESTVVEGTYFLRFDSNPTEYVKVKPEAEQMLLTDWALQIPAGLQVSQRSAEVHLKERREGNTSSEVYELHVTLTISAVPGEANVESTYPITASFPTALAIARTMGTISPIAVPEIIFEVSHYPSNAVRGRGRIFKDLGLALLCALGSALLMIVARPSSMSSEDARHGAAFIGLAVLGGFCYWLFLGLRDLWWIIKD